MNQSASTVHATGADRPQPQRSPTPGTLGPVVVHADDDVGTDLVEYTRRVVGRLLARWGRPTARARVRNQCHGRAGRDAVSVHAVVDLDGTTVAVHRYSPTPREAVDLLVDRLGRRLERLRRRPAHGGHGLPGPHLRPPRATGASS